MLTNRATPGSGLGRLAVESSLQIVAGWVGSLQGNGRFTDVLEHLMTLVRADAVILVRITTGRKTPQKIAVIDHNAHKLYSSRNRPVFSAAILQDDVKAARPGTVWLLSEIFGHLDMERFSETEKLRDYGVRDVAVVTLETGFRSSYFLEFHFSSLFQDHNRLVLLTLSQTLSNIWRDRLPGTAHAVESQSRFARHPDNAGRHVINILSTANPLGLSRSEYRVCMMVRKGFLAKRIATELAVQESTVRSHLRSVYSKAGVSGHVELLHRLSAAPDGGVACSTGWR